MDALGGQREQEWDRLCSQDEVQEGQQRAGTNPSGEREKRKKGKGNHRVRSGPAKPIPVESWEVCWDCREPEMSLRMASEVQKIQGPELQSGGQWWGNHPCAWNQPDIHPFSFYIGPMSGGSSRRWQMLYRWPVRHRFEQCPIHLFGFLNCYINIGKLGRSRKMAAGRGDSKCDDPKVGPSWWRPLPGKENANVGWCVDRNKTDKTAQCSAPGATEAAETVAGVYQVWEVPTARDMDVQWEDCMAPTTFLRMPFHTLKYCNGCVLTFGNCMTLCGGKL